MKTNYNVVTNGTIKQKVIILAKLMILFLVISSSMAMAYTGLSGENKSNNIHRNVVNQTESSSKFSLSPLNPEFISYKQHHHKHNHNHHGSRPSPIDLSYLKNTTKEKLNSLPSSYFRNTTSLGLNGLPSSYFRNTTSAGLNGLPSSYLKNTTSAGLNSLPSRQSYGAGDILPSSYDLRTLNMITPVKDQDGAAVCWCFSTYGSLESYFMPGETWSFSENNMKNQLSSANGPLGFDRGPNDDGCPFMTTAYLARWDGPVSTSDDPFDPTSSLSASEIGLPIHFHVQNVTFLPLRTGPTDNDAIKHAIMDYSAVDCTVEMNNTDPSWGNAYNDATAAYYLSFTPTEWDHKVTIVGWDDSYSASNFKITPPGDGAFIIKNSWSTYWGDNGYAYVSYYDGALGYKENVAFTGDPLDNYANIYQYDSLGWVQSVGYGSTTCWGANIFTANSNEVLNAVSFYTTDLNSNYVINIYRNTVGSNPIGQNSPALIQSGTFPNAGYHTVPLNSGVKLNAGQTFSVVLELTNPNYVYPIPMQTQVTGYSSQSTTDAGESLVSADGNTWTDATTIYPNSVVCIKAFTNPSNPQVTPTITWSNPADIFYGTALDSTQLDATASDPVSGNPVSGSFSYNPSVGTVLATGSGKKLSTTFAPDDVVSYNQAYATVFINVNKATPTIIWSNPANMTYGTALNSTQLDATSSVAGTYLYSPFSGTVLGEGMQKLSVLFIPTDNTDYNMADASVSINVLNTTTK